MIRMKEPPCAESTLLMKERFISENSERIKTLVTQRKRVRFRKTNDVSGDEEQQNPPQPKKNLTLTNLKYFGKFLNTRELLIVKVCIWAILASIVALAIMVWRFGFVEMPKVGGMYTEGMVGQPSHINPLYASTNEVDRLLTRLIYLGLVDYDDQYSIVPALAERWNIEDDGKKYVFHLRNGVLWHDGTPVSVDDILFTFAAIQDEEYMSPLRAEWTNIEVSALDERTIVMVLKEPMPELLHLATVGILPSHIWRQIPALSAPLAEYNIKPVGAGPWKFENLAKDKQGIVHAIELLRNEEAAYHAPWIKQLQFKFFQSSEAAFQALQDHQVEGLGSLPLDRKGAARARKDIVLYSLQSPQYTALFFNQSKNEALKEIAVRRAFGLALDREAIVETALAGEGKVIDGPVLEGYPGYDHAQSAAMIYDPLEAAEMLDDAGWKIDQETRVRLKDGRMLKVVLTTVNQSEYVKTAELVKKQWESVGILVELRFIESGRVQREVIRPREYEILLFGEIVGDDGDVFAFWHSSQANERGLNLAMYAHREADRLLEEARKIQDYEKRAEIMAAFQKILVADIPALFLYNPKYIYPLPKKVQGFLLDRITEPSDRFIGSAGWFIETKRRLR